MTQPDHPVVWVRTFKEKRTDVNLATRILVDYYEEREQYDGVVLVSNDADLAAPLETLRARGMPVGVVLPHPNRTRDLAPEGLKPPHFSDYPRPENWSACILPDHLPGTNLRRPESW